MFRRTSLVVACALAAGLVAGALAGVAFAAVADASAPKPIPGIHSPSGNIRCLFVPPPHASSTPSLHCSITHASYAAELQHQCSAMPAGVDWHGFELSPARRGAVTCSGGILYDPSTERPEYSTLGYGKTWRHGPYTCTSRVTGLTCTNTNRHGLFISRASWRTF
jgi:hypothetical protein